jgi:hypothetical protein
MAFVQVMLMSREEIKFMVAARRYREVPAVRARPQQTFAGSASHSTGFDLSFSSCICAEFQAKQGRGPSEGKQESRADSRSPRARRIRRPRSSSTGRDAPRAHGPAGADGSARGWAPRGWNVVDARAPRMHAGE